MSNTPIMIRARQAQEAFGISRSTLYRWAEAEAKLAKAEHREPRFKLCKLGRATFVDAAEFKAYITSRAEAA